MMAGSMPGLGMIVVLRGHAPSNLSRLMDQAFRLRHRVFVGELGWKGLRSDDGRERDQFDHDQAVHHLCIHDGNLVGYQRLLPTTAPHLLTDVLSDLCEGPVPSGSNIYEWTRNCVAPEWRDSATGMSRFSFELTAGVVEWGLQSGVDCVTVEYDPHFLLRALQMQFLVRPLGYQRVVAGKPTMRGQHDLQRANSCDDPGSLRVLEACRRSRRGLAGRARILGSVAVAMGSEEKAALEAIARQLEYCADELAKWGHVSCELAVDTALALVQTHLSKGTDGVPGQAEGENQLSCKDLM
jgi:acyl-homoserine lactone synthase